MAFRVSRAPPIVGFVPYFVVVVGVPTRREDNHDERAEEQEGALPKVADDCGDHLSSPLRHASSKREPIHHVENTAYPTGSAHITRSKTADTARPLLLVVGEQRQRTARLLGHAAFTE